MTKEEEKQFISQGWKKEIIDPAKKGKEWIKKFLCLPVMFTRICAFTQLCVGIFFYDEFLNELHLLHLKDERFFTLFDTIENLQVKYNNSVEQIFEHCYKKIKQETFKIKDLYQDKYFFNHNFYSKFYVAYGKKSIPKVLYSTNMYNKVFFFDPEYLIHDMYREFKLAAMNDFSQDEVIYKKYKLNKNANTQNNNNEKE